MGCNKILKNMLCLLLVVAMNGFADDPSGYTIVPNLATTPILSPSFADRQILKIQLNNQLQVYLVSDPNLDQSGAALAVGVGSWCDPTGKPGMAHFLEHMLFLGTQKYPEESTYQKYIVENGGSMNAYTAPDRTVYMFSINTTAYEEALDRFAQFFISPLFNPSGVNREMHAVNEEWSKNIPDDFWRLYSIQKELSNPDHPNSQFSTGNLETLGDITQAELISWYESHYSANLMYLAVASPLPMPQLLSFVMQTFAPIPNRNLTPFTFNMPLMAPQNLGTIIAIKPVKELYQMNLVWDLPPSLYYDIPSISSLLSYGGPKSLFEKLKKEGLIENISTDIERFGTSALQLVLELKLTPQGVKEYQKVLTECYATIDYYKNKPYPEEFYDQLRFMASVDYAYPERTDVFNMVITDAVGIYTEGLATYPEKSNLLAPVDPAAVQTLWEALNPQACAYFLLADPQLTMMPPTQTEKWLGGQFSLHPIPSETLTKWGRLPAPSWLGQPQSNPFVLTEMPQPAAATMALKDLPLIPTPTLIENSNGVTLYFAQDERFLNPMVDMILHISSENFNPADVKQVVTLDLYLACLKDQLSTLLYQASMADFSLSITPDSTGIYIEISGYSPKTQVLTQQLLSAISQFTIDAKKFSIQKASLGRAYANNKLALPYLQSLELARSLIYQNRFTAEQKAAALPSVDRKGVLDFSQKLAQKGYIRALLIGDLNQADGKELASLLQNTWLKSPIGSPPPPLKALSLAGQAQPSLILYPRPLQGETALLLIQGPCFSFKNRAAHAILSQGVEQPFYSELRTKQQTGYIVKCMEYTPEDELYLLFVDQSSQYAAPELLARFDLFLQQSLSRFKSDFFTQERFQSIKENLLEQMNQPPNNLSDTAAILDTLAFSYDGDFNRLQKKIQGVHELQYDEFCSYAESILSRSNMKRLVLFLQGPPLPNSYLPTTAELIKSQSVYLTQQEAACAAPVTPSAQPARK